MDPAEKTGNSGIENYAEELKLAREVLAYEGKEKIKRAAELVIANIELAFQNQEKARRAAELIIANKEHAFESEEKEKRATELSIANKELAYQNEEKEKRANELSIANTELAYQNGEKEKRSDELTVANTELLFQSEEKEKRAAELVVANKELAYQNEEKEKRATELSIANTELAYQNGEKEKRSDELTIANTELLFQSGEKEKRAAELVLANKELAFQNEEKGKRAAELILANLELAFQNEEKEKRATEMDMLNKELEQFAFIASHDLQQPLRTVANYMHLFEERYLHQLDENAARYIYSTNNAIKRMSQLINSLLIFSQLGNNRKLATVDLAKVLDNVLEDHETLIKSSNTIIHVSGMPVLNVYETEMYQLFQNLITNAVKFQKIDAKARISISAAEENGKWLFTVTDNGIGIDPVYFEKIFDIFQRLHGHKEYEGSGIGLANCKKIVQLHNGDIWLESALNKGTTFYFTIPILAL